MASFKNCWGDLDAEFGGKGGLACQTAQTESAAVSRGNAKIDPDVQRHDHESRAKQPPPNGEEGPEYAAIAEFPHPEPFLYPASEKREDGDQGNNRDRSGNHPPHRASDLWAFLLG